MTNLSFKALISSPIGSIILTSNGLALTGLYLKEHKNFSVVSNFPDNTAIFDKAIIQLNEYFEGKRRKFALNLNLVGSAFQLKTWDELNSISYGRTKSYKDIATLIGNSNASRAVGSAIGKNPISIIVPCHRVVGANGFSTGYSGGKLNKEWLLKHEEKYFV